MGEIRERTEGRERTTQGRRDFSSSGPEQCSLCAPWEGSSHVWAVPSSPRQPKGCASPLAVSFFAVSTRLPFSWCCWLSEGASWRSSLLKSLWQQQWSNQCPSELPRDPELWSETLQSNYRKKNPKPILAFVTNLGDIYQLGDRKYHIFPPSPVTVWVWCVGQLGIRWPEPIFPEGHGDLTGTEWIPMGCAKQVAIGSCLHLLLLLSFISLEEQWCF